MFYTLKKDTLKGIIYDINKKLYDKIDWNKMIDIKCNKGLGFFVPSKFSNNAIGVNSELADEIIDEYMYRTSNDLTMTPFEDLGYSRKNNYKK